MFDRLAKSLRSKIRAFDESGMGYWMVIATLKDGRRYSNVFVTEDMGLGFPDLCPFKAKDIVDVEWEGYRGSRSSGKPKLLSEAQHNEEL